MFCRRWLLFLLPAFFTTAVVTGESYILDKDLRRQVATYINSVKSVVCDFRQIVSSGDVYLGRIFIRQGALPKVLIEYSKGISQFVLVDGRVVSVYDGNTGDIHSTGISGTPIYEVLTGTFDVDRNRVEIEEETDKIVRFSVNKNSAGRAMLNLVFSKYPNGNLRNLIGWIIDDGKNVTTFIMDEETMQVNDPKTVPDSIFSLPSKK